MDMKHTFLVESTNYSSDDDQQFPDRFMKQKFRFQKIRITCSPVVCSKANENWGKYLDWYEGPKPVPTLEADTLYNSGQ